VPCTCDASKAAPGRFLMKMGFPSKVYARTDERGSWIGPLVVRVWAPTGFLYGFKSSAMSGKVSKVV
jgi:hypothetical protein